jgi:hypothetical protein
MARPNRPNDQSAKEQAPNKTPESEQEEEGNEKKDPEQEQQRDQNRYGNAALNAMMGASVAGATGAPVPGYASSQQKEDISGDVSYGGDGDAEDAPPLTIEELVRSWNPKGSPQKKELESETRSELRVDLPGEDAAFLEAVRTPQHTSAHNGPDDRLYQPTASTVISGLTPWAKEVRQWSTSGTVHRTLLALITPAAPFLQDPAGRGVLSRARAAAIATGLILDGPDRDPASAALAQFCLEIAGSGMRVQRVWNTAAASDEQLPLARDLCAAAIASGQHALPKRALDGDCRKRLITSITGLANLGPTAGFLPDLRVPSGAEDEDDPLGLDDVLHAFTGAVADPQSALYDTALQTAERLAVACAHTRIRYAGVSAAVGHISSHWSSGTPTADLLGANALLDQEIQKCLRLLVEIARAAKGQSVDVQGLRNGLKRAVKLIEKTRLSAAERLATIVGQVILPNPKAPLATEPPDDALAAAWADGSYAAALDVLQTHPQHPDTDIAVALLQTVLSNDHTQSVTALERFSDRTRHTQPVLSAALDVCHGGCALWAEDGASAQMSALRLMELGRRRRNGMLLTAGGITAMSVAELDGDLARAERLRRDIGSELFHMGAAAGLTLLARWQRA